MNGPKTPSPLRRRGYASHLFHSVLDGLRSPAAGTDQSIAGSAPPPKACNDNQPGEGSYPATEDEIKYSNGFKVRGYCCPGQTHGCFVHKADDGTEKLWCRSRGVWTEETLVCY